MKLYIGGKQTRPDSGYSFPVMAAAANCLAKHRLGIAKIFATRWKPDAKRTDGENPRRTIARRCCTTSRKIFRNAAGEIDKRLAAVVGNKQAAREVRLSVERIFSYAAWSDKFDGAVHNPPFRNISIAMNEPLGTVDVICPADRHCWDFSQWCCRWFAPETP